jgi:predicted dinucleotide-binding enzyme
MAKQLSPLASAASVPNAIEAGEVVIFAVWFDMMKELIEQNRSRLAEKVVVDVSNPVTANDKGELNRTLPDGISSGSVIEGLIPPSTHFVKAFGTLSAGSLEEGANRSPKRAVLFYATDDSRAQVAIERLITVSGFDPVRAGGVDAAIRIEMFGDLHEYGGLNGKLVDASEARTAIAGGG